MLASVPSSQPPEMAPTATATAINPVIAASTPTPVSRVRCFSGLGKSLTIT